MEFILTRLKDIEELLELYVVPPQFGTLENCGRSSEDNFGAQLSYNSGNVPHSSSCGCLCDGVPMSTSCSLTSPSLPVSHQQPAIASEVDALLSAIELGSGFGANPNTAVFSPIQVNPCPQTLDLLQPRIILVSYSMYSNPTGVGIFFESTQIRRLYV